MGLPIFDMSIVSILKLGVPTMDTLIKDAPIEIAPNLGRKITIWRFGRIRANG